MTKVHSDLHSSIYKNQKIRSSSVRRGERDMFREGTSLGYEIEKPKHLSRAKFEEYMGEYSR